MTLCIAATCVHENEPAIVLCSDWRAESGDLAGGDVEDKLSWIVPGEWAALKAGVISDADRLAVVYRTTFHNLKEKITPETVLPTFTGAFQHYRLSLITDYLIATSGIDYMTLLKGVRTSESDPFVEFPESYIEKKLNDIEAVPFPNCQLIVAGFVGTMPFLCVLNESSSDNLSWSRTRLETNFAAIGSGASSALTSLYRREHTGASVGLMKALYHVYEAKLLGEISPGVGVSTSIIVLFPNRRCWVLTGPGHEYMEKRFDYFGPMKIGNKKRPNLSGPFFKFDGDYFAEYDCASNNASNSEMDQT